LAVHADAAEQVTAPAVPTGEDTTADATPSTDHADQNVASEAEPTVQQPLSNLRWPLALGAVVLFALGGLFGWLGYHAYRDGQVEQQHNRFLEAGLQAALNLTTISADTADTDVARILDSTTGAFHDDWQQRAPAFVDVVKKAQSRTSGSVTAAALQSIESDKARVLVAVSVTTTTAGAPEQKPRAWRMRIDVQKVGDAVKVADVEFVA
jgi:Mce-associated membrane protein